MITEITLTPEQTSVLQESSGPVVVTDPYGKRIGEIARLSKSHFSPNELAAMEAKRGQDGPYVTTAELLARLQGTEAK